MSSPACNPGEVPYKGICMPSYMTQAEMELAYQEIVADQVQEKGRAGMIIGVLVGLIAVAFVVTFYLS